MKKPLLLSLFIAIVTPLIYSLSYWILSKGNSAVHTYSVKFAIKSNSEDPIIPAYRLHNALTKLSCSKTKNTPCILRQLYDSRSVANGTLFIIGETTESILKLVENLSTKLDKEHHVLSAREKGNSTDKDLLLAKVKFGPLQLDQMKTKDRQLSMLISMFFFFLFSLLFLQATKRSSE